MELDSHANMPVVGSQCYVIQDTGKKVDVSPFTPDYTALSNISVIDAAVLHVCTYTGKESLLVLRNALYVPSMCNNLIPPFIIWEAGVTVNDVPKIHVTDPSEEDHAITFPDDTFRIPLRLHGIFSYFSTCVPTSQQVEECDNVYLLTPENHWNPHDTAYAHNEDSMLDWDGNIKDHCNRDLIIIKDLPDGELMALDACVSHIESTVLEHQFTHLDSVSPETETTISPIYDCDLLAQSLTAMAIDSHYKSSIGATVTCTCPYLYQAIVTEPPRQELHEQDVSELLQAESLGTLDLDSYMTSATHVRARRNITPEHLSKVWHIDHKTAKRTLDVTTQRNSCPVETKLTRNYTSNDKMLRYTRIHDHFYMDTFFATKHVHRSLRGNTCCQLFVTDKGFLYAVPMRTKSLVLQALKQFVKEIGAPEVIICDHSGEQSSREIHTFCSDIGTTLRYIEEGTPWANKAELYIGLLKESVRKDMKETNCPLVLWDYCVERRTRVNNLTAKSLFQLHGTTPYTALTSKEGDISNLCQFAFYNWCYYQEQTAKFPFNKEVLGRVLGPAKGAGNEMAQWILKANGRVVPRRTCRPLNTAELHSPSELQKRTVFTRLITSKLGDSINPPSSPLPEMVDEEADTNEDDDEFEPYEDPTETPLIIPDQEDTVDATGHLLNQQPVYDRMLNAEVQLQNGDEIGLAKVLRRAIGPDSRVAGEYNENPLLNSIVYEVEFSDGQIKEYAANIIAENMLRQVNHEGYSTTLMAGTVDYSKDESTAVSKSDKWVYTKRGGRRLRKSTAGWKLEMRNVGIAFQILENDKAPPPGWVKATGHIIFDCKMDMTRKARWVLDGHKTSDPSHSTYAGVVSRESVQIALTYAALNHLDVTAADIRNAYLQAPSSEKHFIVCGPEFGAENVGKKALIRRALYGGKSAGRDFRNHLRACMIHLDFLPCRLIQMSG